MGCDSKDHERFHGVFFCKNGCLACEIEEVQAKFDSCLNILRDLYDLQNGPPLIKYEKEWKEVMSKAEYILISEEIQNG